MTKQNDFATKQNEQNGQLRRAEDKAKESEANLHLFETRCVKAEGLLLEKETERQAAQNELDDLLMVFGDLEEKASKYKERLRSLGESVSDGEEDDDEEEEDEGEDENEDEVD